jgi:hypothetical protein
MAPGTTDVSLELQYAHHGFLGQGLAWNFLCWLEWRGLAEVVSLLCLFSREGGGNRRHGRSVILLADSSRFASFRPACRASYPNRYNGI